MVALIYLSPIIVLLLLILWYALSMWNIRKKLPPGPKGWPVIGNIGTFLYGNRHLNLMKIGKEYGGIFTANIGVQYSVWISSYRLFREATVSNVWEFAGRPSVVTFGDLEPGIIASGIDEDAREVRRWTLVSLRSFGFGKADMQNVILDEASILIEEIRKKEGKSFDPRQTLANASANVISAILLGKTFQYGDAGFHFVHDALTEGIKLVLVNARHSAFPLLKWLPNKPVQRFVDSFRDASNFLKKMVDEHEVTHVRDSPRDYIDMWLDQGEKESGSHARFTKSKLRSVLVDLFGGGFETTTTSLQWVLIMMLHHPEVQTKIHQELDSINGKGRMITLDDRDNLPYTEAAIWESGRLFTVIPFSVPHLSTQDAVLGGYKIPANTRVLLHLFAIHHDPDLWEAAEEFRPERFVTEGKLKLPEYYVPFSAGRRSCIGLPSLNLNDAVVMYPDPFTLVAKDR